MLSDVFSNVRRSFSLKCFLDAALEFVIEKWNSNNKTKCISKKKEKKNRTCV